MHAFVHWTYHFLYNNLTYILKKKNHLEDIYTFMASWSKVHSATPPLWELLYKPKIH